MAILNGALAFCRYTNARNAVTLDPEADHFTFKPGLTPEELVGMFFRMGNMAGTLAIILSAKYHEEYPDEVISCRPIPFGGMIMYYSIKTGIASTNIDDVISKETPSLGPKPYVLDKGLTSEQLKDKDLGDGKSITNAEHAEGDPDYIYRCTLSDDSKWYYNSNTGLMALTIEGTNA